MRRAPRLAAGLLAALAVLSTDAGGPRAVAADPPAAPAGASPLTADERAFFAWWDTLEFPDVTKLPFVKLWTPYGRYSAAAGEDEGDWPEGAFLIAEQGREFTVFHTDLTVDRLETTPPDASDERNRGTRFERADLGPYVRDGLARIERVGPEVAWFAKPDPFDAHRWSIPNQAFRIAVLARACAGRGLDDLAHRLLDRALHEQTRPALTQQWGDDDPRPRAALDSLKGSIESEARDILLRSYSDASLSWADLLRAEERFARAFAPARLTEPDGRVARLRAIVAEEQRARDHPPKPFESLTQEERIDRLIHDLRDVGAYDRRWRAREDEEKRPPDAAERLKSIGLPAVPALIDALDDDRVTRSVNVFFSHKGQFRDSAWGRLVGDLAWEILDHLSAGTLEATPHGGPPTSAQPTKRQVAERWYATVKGRGEQWILADAVKRGGRGARAAADRLVKIDVEAAVEAIEAGIRASDDERGERRNLVYALVAIPSQAATEALLRLLPTLRGSGSGVSVASSLFQRGRKEGLDDLIREWREQGRPETPDDPVSGFLRRARFGFDDVISALAASNELAAVVALADGLASRGIDDRIAVVQAFQASDPAFRATPLAPTSLPSEATEQAIENLLAGRLEDVERRRGMTSGDKAVGREPVVGELAAWALAGRYPKRYAFDPDASPRERDAQRIAAANAWRAARGMAAIEPPRKRPAPTPIPIDALRADIDRAATGADAAARATAIAALESKGLPAVPALRAALESLGTDVPGRPDLEALLRRLALAVADVRIAGPASLAGDEFKAALEATKGRPITGAMWWDLCAKFSTSAPDGATTRLALAMERDGAERGVIVTATLSPAKPGIGTQDEGDASFEHPTLRRDDEVKRGGSGAMPISVFARPGGFSEYEAEFDRVLASTGPEAVVSIEGEVTVHR